MKTKILLVALLSMLSISLSGCGSSPKPLKEVNALSDLSSNTYRVIRIGKCQYIQMKGYDNQTTLTHKGDCDNPIHIYNKVK